MLLQKKLHFLIRVLPTHTTVCPLFEELNRVVKEKLCYERVDVNDYSSPDTKKKYKYIQGIYKGLTAPAVMYTHSLGSNLGNYHFLWRIPHEVTLEAAMNENIKLMDQIKSILPTYHSRAIRKRFMDQYGCLTKGGVKSHILRQMYHELTVCSCSS